MIRSLYTAATGMEAQQLFMDTISNNLANVNTNGYKRARVEFQDLIYENLKSPGTTNQEGGVAPVGIEVGLGVKPGATQKDFEQGSLTQTGTWTSPFRGTVFSRCLCRTAHGLSRDGAFKLTSDGTIVTSSGYPVSPQITVPNGAQQLGIDSSTGNVTAVMSGETTSTQIGQIELARFVNPAGLKSVGNNLLLETEASGQPIVGTPGEDGFKDTTLQQQYLEASNVQVVDEMVNMISAERAYEIVSKSIQVSEDMMQIANNLKR